MNFNPDPNKEAQKVILCRKSKKINHVPLIFNNSQVSWSLSQKHLVIILDEQLTFCAHLKMLTSKINKTIDRTFTKNAKPFNKISFNNHIWSFRKISSWLWWYNICQAYNASFHHKFELFQCSSCLAKTGATRGTYKEKSYQELGLEFLQLRRWFRKQCFFHKIYKSDQPVCLSSIVHNGILLAMIFDFLKNSLFPSNAIEWNKLDPNFGMKIVFTFLKIMFCNS